MLSHSTTRGLPIKCYASICPGSSKSFRFPNFWNPLDAPHSFVGLGVGSNACFGVD